MFDLDNTLLDFSRSSHLAFFKVMEKHDLSPSEELYQIYAEENLKIWKLFEDKQITTDQLRKIRFKGFFERVDIRGIDPFAFNAEYLDFIIETSEPYEGVVSFLKGSKPKYKLSIITNGLKEVQRPRLHKTGIYDLFDSIVVSDEIGIAKPGPAFFEYSCQSLSVRHQKSDILVIGDSLNSDIRGGQNFGVDTCWISLGRKNESDISPTMTIEQVRDLELYL